MQKIIHCRRKYCLILSSPVDFPEDSDLASQFHVLDFFLDKIRFLTIFLSLDNTAFILHSHFWIL